MAVTFFDDRKLALVRTPNITPVLPREGPKTDDPSVDSTIRATPMFSLEEYIQWHRERD
jgi:hypothetical protein